MSLLSVSTEANLRYLSYIFTADKLDTNFDNGFGAWTAKRFSRKSGRASYQLPKDGPSKDHTSQVSGKGSGKLKG